MDISPLFLQVANLSLKILMIKVMKDLYLQRKKFPKNSTFKLMSLRYKNIVLSFYHIWIFIFYSSLFCENC